MQIKQFLIKGSKLLVAILISISLYALTFNFYDWKTDPDPDIVGGFIYTFLITLMFGSWLYLIALLLFYALATNLKNTKASFYVLAGTLLGIVLPFIGGANYFDTRPTGIPFDFVGYVISGAAYGWLCYLWFFQTKQPGSETAQVKTIARSRVEQVVRKAGKLLGAILICSGLLAVVAGFYKWTQGSDPVLEFHYIFKSMLLYYYWIYLVALILLYALNFYFKIRNVYVYVGMGVLLGMVLPLTGGAGTDFNLQEKIIPYIFIGYIVSGALYGWLCYCWLFKNQPSPA